MVIDTSTIIALLLGEAETVDFVATIAADRKRIFSAASYLEAAIVITSRSGPQARDQLDRLLEALGVEIVPFAHDQAILAAIAYQQFGKGSGHSAALNFGDCFTYALAKLTGEPVLFKGDDFSRTDLVSAAAKP